MISSSDRNNSYDKITDGDHLIHVRQLIAESSQDLEVVLPEANQLQLDYDEKFLSERFYIGMDLLAQAYVEPGDTLSYVVTTSKSGNIHITVNLPNPVDAVTRIAWQAVFGSDLTREGLSLVSVVRGLKNPTLLIEKKGRKFRHESWTR